MTKPSLWLFTCFYLCIGAIMSRCPQLCKTCVLGICTSCYSDYLANSVISEPTRSNPP